MWCYSQTVWRHYKNENTTQQVKAASLGVPAGLQWWSGRRYFTSCRVTRLFNVPSRCSLPPSPPLGSGSSRQHSASLQQWTQGLVRPPQRATEGSPLSQLRTAQQQQQRTGATFPRSITHGSGSAQKRHRDAVFLEETDGIVKKDLRDFVLVFFCFWLKRFFSPRCCWWWWWSPLDILCSQCSRTQAVREGPTRYPSLSAHTEMDLWGVYLFHLITLGKWRLESSRYEMLLRNKTIQPAPFGVWFWGNLI